MKRSVIENYKHQRPTYNCPHFAAWAVGQRCKLIGWHNLRHGFMPPIVEGISLEPNNPDYVLAEEDKEFSLEMFQPGGFLHEEPLNHYINFRLFNTEKKFSVNAGYLMYHFLLGEAFGYAELARLCKLMRAKPASLGLEDMGNEGGEEPAHRSADDAEGT